MKASGARTKQSGARTKQSGARTKQSGARTKQAIDLPALVAAQRARLRLGEHDGLKTLPQAAKFLGEVGVALRYGPNAALPLASIYQAVWRLAGKRPEPEPDAHRRATELANALISDGTAIEITVVADRVGLAHATLVPALIALCRRGRDVAELDLSDTARRALAFLADYPRPTAGAVRAHLGVPPQTWPNVADDALAELQRGLVIDRGPAEVPAIGMAYLSKDGIPYRIVDVAHAAHVRVARKLGVAAAATTLISRYLDGALFASRKKLASLFARCVSRSELDEAIAGLVAAGRVELATGDRDELVVQRS